MRHLLWVLLGILLVPTMTMAQHNDIQLTKPQIAEKNTIETALVVIDSLQQVYLENNGEYALLPMDSIGLDLGGFVIRPWGVTIDWSGASNDVDNPDWGIVLKYGNAMCWWPERIFGNIPPHIEKEVRGDTLACAFGWNLRGPSIGQQLKVH